MMLHLLRPTQWLAWPRLGLWFGLCGLWISSLGADTGILQLRHGYFWDPVAREYFIPRGVAYQVWNPPVGANQSLEQVAYDLTEFKKMGANSVRAEFVWSQVEVQNDQYDWSKPDFLVAKAEELGLRLFLLIGFQYPPAWFPKAWHGINNQGLTADVVARLTSNVDRNVQQVLPSPLLSCLQSNTNLTAELVRTVLSCMTTTNHVEILNQIEAKVPADKLRMVLNCLISDVLNYEHPEARRVYQEHITRVVSRYKESPAIGGWIIGNEYAYFDLWEDPNKFPTRRFLGYDEFSQKSFRDYLAAAYQGDLARLNANWGSSYTNFQAVVMPKQYPSDRNNPGYHDVLQWRKDGIGDFIGLGAVAAKRADPNHLITYSMVGGIFNGNDANNTTEDAKAIVARCKAAGAPLDFWSINNYAWASMGSEMRSADYGIGKYQAVSGLPVMISETGHSSTEDLFDGGAAGPRQAKALPGQLWESLISGAIGTHFFHWNDRTQFTLNYFLRERGFGIVSETRLPKDPVYRNILDMFRRMENVRLEALLGGSSNPPPDIQFFWSVATDMGWPRANQENAMLWGALKRLGYQPSIIDDDQFDRGAYTNAPALLLSRAYQLEPRHLDRIAQAVIPAGIHVHANADFPGQFDTYHRPNPNWASLISSLFGLRAANAVAAFDSGVTNDASAELTIRGSRVFGSITPSYSARFLTWKIWHGVQADSGTTVLTHAGVRNSQPGTPGLQIKLHPTAKAAMNTFSFGDSFVLAGPPAQLWDMRYDLLKAIYRDHFGIIPAIELSGPGAKYVMPDYRLCQNGSVLISLLNEHTNQAQVTLSAPALLSGKTVESITSGRVLRRDSQGELKLDLAGDDYLLLYAYDRKGGRNESLITSNPNKIWIESAPLAVWPDGRASQVEAGFDLTDAGVTFHLSFEQVRPGQNKAYARSSSPVAAQGQGKAVQKLIVPDADLHDPDYQSTPDGGQYIWRAWLEKEGAILGEATLPVRLLWGVRPTRLPEVVVAGGNYEVPIEWEELPSYEPEELGTPLSRADLWESLQAQREHYNIVVELEAGGKAVASDRVITSSGSGTSTLRINVPRNATGPFAWSARIETFANASDDLVDSFEGRERGADTQLPKGAPSLVAPWQSQVYSDRNTAEWYDLGVHLEGSHGSQSAFMVAWNPQNSGDFAGFFIFHSFPKELALPANRDEWKNWVISVDFMERNNLPCLIELQLKNKTEPNGRLRLIHFLKEYERKGWQTIRASLDQFQLPQFSLPFDLNKITELVINVQMLQKDAVYIGSFDNIHFDRPERLPSGGGTVKALYSSANDFFGLRIARPSSGEPVILSWPGRAVLQSSSGVMGPWQDVVGAATPWTVKPDAAGQFFRLRR